MGSVRKQLAVTTLILFLASTGIAANSIGTVPGIYQFGEVERGETVEGTIHITTNLNSEFDLKPGYSHPVASVYKTTEQGPHYNLSGASQQNMSEWLRFDKPSFKVDPSTDKQINTDSGTSNAEGEISFEVNIPGDAEPGYHLGGIELNPDVDSGEASGSSLLNLGVTNPLFVFRVPGDAERDIEVMRLNGVRLGEDLARADILVRNVGDTTVQIVGSDVEIEGGNLTVGDARFGTTYIKPGDVEVLESAWRGENVSAGLFTASTELDYISDSSGVEQEFRVPSEIQRAPEYEEVASEDESSPIILILIIIAIILAVLIYLDVKVKWSLILSGIVGLLLYILL